MTPIPAGPAGADATSRPTFGAKPDAPPKSPRKKYAVAEQESLDFLAQRSPDLHARGNYFECPREVKRYIQSLASPAAKDFVLELVDRTYGGQFSADYGAAAAALTRPLKGQYHRPRWAAFTVAEAAAISGSTESGAAKFLAELEATGAVESRRAMGQLWYAPNTERMVELTKPRQARKVAPDPATTNIPHDAKPAKCEGHQTCLRAVIKHELAGGPILSDSQIVDSIRAASKKSAEHGRFTNPLCAADGTIAGANLHQCAASSGETFVLASGSPPRTRRQSVDHVRFRRGAIDYPAIPVDAITLAGHTLDITLAPDATARSRPWLEALRDQDEACEMAINTSPATQMPDPIAAGVEAADRLTLADITRRLNDRLRSRLGARVPPSTANAVYQLIQTPRAWQLLETRIARREGAMKSWSLAILLAKEAAEVYQDELVAAPATPAARDPRFDFGKETYEAD